MQHYKGDDLELKFEAAIQPILDVLSMQKDLFFDGAYDCGPLGDLLHEDDRSPLANAIKLEIFRTSFNTIYNAFTVSGSFESYLVVFRKIFGDTVDVTFTVPAPGKLNIDIVADELEEAFFVERHIVSNHYFFDNVVWYDTVPDGGNIVFQSVKGFKTQYELEQMLFEMVPAGIFTEITLTFGA
jgi:hypothetical protein